MGLGEYLLGVLLLALIAGPLAIGSYFLRARVLAGWRGAPARVAESVIGIAALLAIVELLGTVGLFRDVPVVVACVLAGGAGARLGRARRPTGEAPPHPRSSALGAGVALAGCAVVVTGWVDRTYDSVRNGMSDADTLWYHLPYAARWVQEGSLTDLHFTSYEPLTTFYPSNPSIVHAVGMLAFGNDVLSPYVNLGWLALGLAAAWCIGRPFGAAPATLLGGAAVMGAPIMVAMQAGSAKDDLPGLGLTLAAIALLVNGWGSRAAVALAGVATGLLLGVKLSMVAPALLLTVAVIVAAPRARRAGVAVTWVAALVAAGGYWYLRNLARTGNPVPWFAADVGPLSLPRPELLPYTERHVKGAVADYATDSGFWSDVFFPSAEGTLGPAWWAMVALALAGLVGLLFTGRERLRRALAAAGIAMAVAYLLTPGGAGGSPEGIPHLVFWSLRYLTPALAVGLACLPLLPALRDRRRQWWALAAYAAIVVATQFGGGVFRLWDRRPSVAALGTGAVLLLAALAAARGFRPRLGPRAAAAAVLGLGVAILAVGWAAQDEYFRSRYTDPSSSLVGPYEWARDRRDTRIAIVGFYLQHPIYGEDLSNRVQYVGHEGGRGEFRPAETCAEWRRALNEGGYRYLIAAPFNFPWVADDEPRETAWTLAGPGAAEVARFPGAVSIIRLDRPLDPAECPRRDRGRPGGGTDSETGPRRPSS